MSDYPEPRDEDAWRQRFEALPEKVKQALYDYAPTTHPDHAEAIAWAVIAATEAEQRILITLATKAATVRRSRRRS